jgi:dolichol-phosphate mannosyltransferase
MQYSVILPTLNENGHIEKLIISIEEIFNKNKKNYEIIVVDDQSVDGTIDTIKSLAKRDEKLKLFVRNNLKKNLADSINLGIVESRYENIIWMDADFQHPPKYIEEFIKKSEYYDAIICSRFLYQSERYFKNKNINKKDINENQSYIFNKICKYFLYKDITDYTSGYICIKKNILEKIKLKGFYGDYFVNLLTFLKREKYKIIEIPFRDEMRATGLSKTVVNFNFKYIYTCFRYFLTLLNNIFKKIN